MVLVRLLLVGIFFGACSFNATEWGRHSRASNEPVWANPAIHPIQLTRRNWLQLLYCSWQRTDRGGQAALNAVAPEETGTTRTDSPGAVASSLIFGV